MRYASIAFTGMCLISGCTAIRTSQNTASAGVGSPISTSGSATVEVLEANRFRVRLTNIERIAAKQPRDTQLCWAACAQMVLRAHATELSQEQIAAHFVRGDQGANVDMMTRAMVPDLEDDYLRRQATHNVNLWSLFGRHAHSDFLLEELSAGQPAVVGLRDEGATQGHTCVVVGATYSVAEEPSGLKGWFLNGFRDVTDGMNRDEKTIHRAYTRYKSKYVLHEVALIDPDPDAPLVTYMSGEEFARLEGFLISSNLARAHVREAIRTASRRETKTKTVTTTKHYNVNIGWQLGKR